MAEYLFRAFQNIENVEGDVEYSFAVTQKGDATRDEKAKLDADGVFHAEGFGILGGNLGIDFVGEAGVITVEKGIITAAAADVIDPDDFTEIVMNAGRWEPLSNGDPAGPELVFNSDGDVIMVWIEG